MPGPAPNTRLDDGVLIGATVLALLTISSVFLPLGITRWAMVALITVWAFLQFRTRDGVPTAVGIAVVSCLSTGALVAILDPRKDFSVATLVGGFAAFSTILGTGTGLFRENPPVLDLDLYRKWVEVAVLIGLAIGFIALPFEPFQVAADGASRGAFAAALIGAALMGPARIGIFFGRLCKRIAATR